MKTPMQIGLVLFLAVDLLSATETPSSVAEKFCHLEMTGIGLDGRTSGPLLELTTGEEEPFSETLEIVSECKVAQTEPTSSTTADVVVEYSILGKIREDNLGLKHILHKKNTEKIRFRLLFVDGNWKISRKSLADVPVHATAKAWARNFQDLLNEDNKAHPALDRNLQEVVAQLTRM